MICPDGMYRRVRLPRRTSPIVPLFRHKQININWPGGWVSPPNRIFEWGCRSNRKKESYFHSESLSAKMKRVQQSFKATNTAKGNIQLREGRLYFGNWRFLKRNYDNFDRGKKFQINGRKKLDIASRLIVLWPEVHKNRCAPFTKKPKEPATFN